MPFAAPPIHTETEALVTFAQQQVRQLRSTALNLTWEQATATPLPSSLSIAGLVAHSVQVIHGWLAAAQRAPEVIPLEEYAHITAGTGLPEGSFSGCEVPEGISLERLLGMLDDRVDELAEVIPGLDLDLEFPNPAPQYMPAESYSNRWAVNHIITEIARHAGHADLIREAIDGATAYELNFYADGGTPEQWAEQAAAWGIE